jgi:dTDP-4-dehydrorhamnose reductase
VPGWWRRESRFIDAVPQGPNFECHPGAAANDTVLLIVGDDGPLTHLAVRACEVRGLHYAHVREGLRECLQRQPAWAVLDARDREGVAGPRRRYGPDGRTSVARTCADAAVPCALFASAFGPSLAAEGLSLPGVLVARTGPVYVPWDSSTRAVRLLDQLDGGRPVEADAAQTWHGVYGPDLLDGVLDLLLDKVEGGVNFFPAEGWSEAELLRHMALVAEKDPGLVTVLGAPASEAPKLPSGPSYAPPSETTLERFVRECRLARREGEMAIHRRQDEVRSGEVG